MPTSWVLEGRQKNSCSKLKNLTHFSLHIDGFCVFHDLDCHLPPSLTCVSISVSLPAIGARRSLSSLMDLVKRLANVNAYPDLEELHLQDEMESREDDAEDSDSCSNDSFFVESDEVVSEEEEDELDLLEQQLESETDRRHDRYVKKKSRMLSDSSEEGERHSFDDEDGIDLENITDYEDDEEEEQQNPLIDDEAEEVDSDEETEESIGTESDGEDVEHSSDPGMLDGEAEEVESGMESEDGSDTEPEGEDAAFSSDEEMLVSFDYSNQQTLPGALLFY
ncbi:hypothetical protein TELCIR_13261 [Teladorsagia circumcincta]|uniref:Uncharacterized protein n=1 Tax=Teladorsagia circumcincta TaxID=45464 RepID=A0A2G9U484_TELCI|nr:hypothetical protein TELCIR_13261 [Teladorsagia circumcincta]